MSEVPKIDPPCATWSSLLTTFVKLPCDIHRAIRVFTRVPSICCPETIPICCYCVHVLQILMRNTPMVSPGLMLDLGLGPR
ncbi:hypothetical protein PsYK624_038650 [Phanerochaete sordida]|uniref:Uncharacterized protein n=1 Tax=Phanerochaete sordida TaxID=48140 RepID=A0A9P3G473_9APHY|nr:hypothetical protein PsYK624_038650 [Phanerochaete sordida]